MSTSTPWKWLAVACLAHLVCAGCIPVITGGAAEVDVYVADDPNDRLLHGTERDGKKTTIPDLTQRAWRPPRAVVIPGNALYYSEEDDQYLPACVVTPTQRRIHLNRRIGFTEFSFNTRDGPDLMMPRRSYVAWVFVEGGWPVYIKYEMFSCEWVTGTFTSKWNNETWDEFPVPWYLEARGMAFCYPASRPWDKFVAAGAGCGWFELSAEENPNPPWPGGRERKTSIGAHNTLWVLSEVPCPFIKSVDKAKGKLTDEDRLLVFRQTLLLYEMTQSYWDSDDPIFFGDTITRRESYEQNTRLLRERIESLEAKGKR